MIKISGFKDIEIENIVFDYNGTLAKDGQISNEIKNLLKVICSKYNVYVITADTFGTVKEELKELDLEVKVLSSCDHTNEKMEFILSLGKEVTVAIGNGNNDKSMLKSAVISIAIIGDEGCSKEALFASSIICKDIKNVIELFLYPKRLVATLRK